MKPGKAKLLVSRHGKKCHVSGMGNACENRRDKGIKSPECRVMFPDSLKRVVCLSTWLCPNCRCQWGSYKRDI